VTRPERTLSPRDLAAALGVSESSVKRWVDAGELDAGRTAGGHRRIALPEAVRFARAKGLSVLRPDLLGLADLAGLPADLAEAPVTAGLLVDRLANGRAEHASNLVVAAYLRGDPLAPLCDGPVREAMHEVGKLWEQGRRGIFVEHRATDLFHHAFHQIRALIPEPNGAAPRAVGGALAGDPYLLPSLMAATVLADLGFAVAHLGPDTPADVLAAAAREHRAGLVWLSVSVADTDQAVVEASRALAEGLTATGAEIVVGGRRTEGMALPAWPNLQHRSDMAGLVEVAHLVRNGSA
jgi:MerR family transcriptional regulator, light-induced transcriptional regulator